MLTRVESDYRKVVITFFFSSWFKKEGKNLVLLGVTDTQPLITTCELAISDVLFIANLARRYRYGIFETHLSLKGGDGRTGES